MQLWHQQQRTPFCEAYTGRFDWELAQTPSHKVVAVTSQGTTYVFAAQRDKPITWAHTSPAIGYPPPSQWQSWESQSGNLKILQSMPRISCITEQHSSPLFSVCSWTTKLPCSLGMLTLLTHLQLANGLSRVNKYGKHSLMSQTSIPE